MDEKAVAELAYATRELSSVTVRLAKEVVQTGLLYAEVPKVWNKILAAQEKTNSLLARYAATFERIEALLRYSSIVVRDAKGVKVPLDYAAMMSLPDHLRDTAMALHKLGRATASMVAEVTKKARALESGYLNTLIAMGYVHSDREGRNLYFNLILEEPTSPIKEDTSQEKT